MIPLRLKMQRKLSFSLNILLVFLLVCITDPVFTRSIGQDKCKKCATDNPRIENHFNFNACRFPTNDKQAKTSLENTGIKVDYGRSELKEILDVTEKVLVYIRRNIKAIERKIRCKHQLRKLKEKLLEDVIKIQSSAGESLNVSSTITKTYMEIATLTNLLNHLDSALPLTAKDCCLSYPSKIAGRLRNRILKKWYNIKDIYGDTIDISQCTVSVHIYFNGPAECSTVRDAIYLLLRHILDVLKHSKLVTRAIISEVKRD